MRWLVDLFWFVFDPPGYGNGYIRTMDRPAPQEPTGPDDGPPPDF